YIAVWKVRSACDETVRIRGIDELNEVLHVKDVQHVEAHIGGPDVRDVEVLGQFQIEAAVAETRRRIRYRLALASMREGGPGLVVAADVVLRDRSGEGQLGAHDEPPRSC